MISLGFLTIMGYTPTLFKPNSNLSDTETKVLNNGLNDMYKYYEKIGNEIEILDGSFEDKLRKATSAKVSLMA